MEYNPKNTIPSKVDLILVVSVTVIFSVDMQTRVWCVCTLNSGLSSVSMMKSYLQSSQQRVSDDLIHWLRHARWTKRRLPVHQHGVISGYSSSPSQWQILYNNQPIQ